MVRHSIISVDDFSSGASKLKDVDLSRVLTRAKRKIHLLETIMTRENNKVYENYNKKKRKAVKELISEIQEEFEGIPLVLEHKAWWFKNDHRHETQRLTPGNKRFPWRITPDSIRIGSWVYFNLEKYIVTGIDFMFRRGMRHTMVHIKGRSSRYNRNIAHDGTVRITDLSPVPIHERMKLASVRDPLRLFFRNLLEHCRYKPGSSLGGFYSELEKNYYTLEKQNVKT